MGDVAPPDLVAVGDVDGVAQHGLLDVHPQTVEAVGGELAVGAAGGVDAVLEAVHRHLAEGGRNGVLETPDEQLEAAARVRLGLEQALERERLAED